MCDSIEKTKEWGLQEFFPFQGREDSKPYEPQCCICGSLNSTEQALCEACQILCAAGQMGFCPACGAMDLSGSTWHIEGCPEYGRFLPIPRV